MHSETLLFLCIEGLDFPSGETPLFEVIKMLRLFGNRCQYKKQSPTSRLSQEMMAPLRAPLAPPSKCFNRGQGRERWSSLTGSHRTHPGTGKSKENHAHGKKRIGGHKRHRTNLSNKLRAEGFTLGLDKWNREEDPNNDSTEKTFEGVCHVIPRFNTDALEHAICTS